MQKDYKRLGEYIRQVNVRNRDLETEVLLGVSITKKLIPSIANVIGTDMSVYKIIEKRQFAYGTVTSRNGEKISIAISDQYDKALVSQIYVVFEVIDTEELLPEYLMMWFSRPEFDRYVRFHSHGSTRETFDWADMGEVELPIPSIEEQRQIVAQYQSIANKIKLNEQICEKLEATAQALYKHWFVDFEFPNSPPPEGCPQDGVAVGAPYKSSGGKMVWNEELGKEIPQGWEVKSLDEVTELISRGVSPSYTDSNRQLIVLNQKCIRNNKISYELSKYHNNERKQLSEQKYLQKFDILINSTGDGTLGRTAFVKEIFQSITVDSHITIMRGKEPYKLFLANNLSEREFEITSLAEGSTGQTELSREKLKKLKVIISLKISIYKEFDTIIDTINKKILFYEKVNPQLTQLQGLLLSRLSVGEDVSV